MHVLSVPNARRIYVRQFPDSNRLAVPKTVIEWGVWKTDETYALGSVLNMIQPYEDSVRELKPLNS